MKKIILTLIASLLLGIPAMAQWCVGGSINYGASYKEHTHSINIKPDVSYTFGNVCVGASLTIELFYDQSNPNPTQSYGISPYVQYYVFSVGPVSLYFEGGVGILNTQYSEGPAWRFTPYINPGLSVELTEHWSVMGYLGRLEYDTYNQYLAFGLEASNFGVGVYYTF